jgi:small subunit ribosomal protein S8
VNDLIADLLTRIQNAIMRRKSSVSVPYTKINAEILRVLKEEGMVDDFEQKDDGTVEVELAYTDEKEPVVTHLERVSKPGQRIYVSSEEIVPILNGRGICILTTSSGIMTGAVAKGKKLGGEYLCKIW